MTCLFHFRFAVLCSHPGSVAVYLRLVQDNIAKHKRPLTLSNFVLHTDINSVITQLWSYKSTKRLTEFFQAEQWQLLERILMQDSDTFTPTEEQQPVALSMAQEGLLVQVDNQPGYTLRFVSPAARELARLQLIHRQSVPVPGGTFDLTNMESIVSGLKLAVRYICHGIVNPAMLSSNQTSGTKQTEMPTEFLKREKDVAPNELTYHFHLTRVMYHWFITKAIMNVAVPVGRGKEADLVISDGFSRAQVLVELCAHVRLQSSELDKKTVEEHVRRVGEKYKKYTDAKHAVVIAFYYGHPSYKLERAKLWWPTVDGKPSSCSAAGVRLIYAIYSKDCKQVGFVSGPSEDQQVEQVEEC
eukprot:TRINITY_DN2412_c0_g5_i2.p1 TRINITY_DN2412_c0_g5~~TRINITY_DN2412_c0_g5_i2.p1  ORF type:complete len:357 (-),score=55.21 TRINITY_DN2412_c0_g5_i2:188-1258(-)